MFHPISPINIPYLPTNMIMSSVFKHRRHHIKLFLSKNTIFCYINYSLQHIMLLMNKTNLCISVMGLQQHSAPLSPTMSINLWVHRLHRATLTLNTTYWCIQHQLLLKIFKIYDITQVLSFVIPRRIFSSWDIYSRLYDKPCDSSLHL